VHKGSLDDRLAAVEYEMLVEALKTHHGNSTEAAEELGITRRVFGLRLDKYKIDYKKYR